MKMVRIFTQPVETVIEKRKSVRTYEEKTLEDKDKKRILSYMKDLTNPFGKKVRFSFLETKDNKKVLGTYGIIKGTVDYIGAAIKNEPLSLEALGYEMEKLILFCQDLGIGTCWLGGTFKREDFRSAMEISPEDLFPAVTPVGYPKEAKSMADNLVRFIAKGNMRKPFGELFFSIDFQHPLSEEEAGEYAGLLEMVRLAPSASNKQPWRILRNDGQYHFYLAKTPRYSDAFSYDIQRIDMGIAACHFQLSAEAKGLKGNIMVHEEPGVEIPDQMVYCFSWVPEQL